MTQCIITCYQTWRFYVENLRTVGATKVLAWAATRQTTSRIQFIGIQDAPKKRRLDNKPWAEGIFSTSKVQLTNSATDIKWTTKSCKIINVLVIELKEYQNKFLEFKRLESDLGFLCLMAMPFTFDHIFPSPMGFHLSRWRNE